MSALFEKEPRVGGLAILRDIVSSVSVAPDRISPANAGVASETSCALRVVSLDAEKLLGQIAG